MPVRLRARFAVAAVAMVASACSGALNGDADAGGADAAATSDAGVTDAGGATGDAGDSGEPDAGCVSVPGLLDDGASHPPPATGTYAYNSFVPPTTPGASYVDPVFGSTVRRVSSDGDDDDLYARNMWWNADGTRYLHRNTNGTSFADFWDVIDIASGEVTHANIPIGGLAPDSGFDPVDPDVLYQVSTGGIERVTLHADGTWAVDRFFTPPAGQTIGSLGGTLNWMDAAGRYMLVRYGPEPSVHLYDREDMAAGPYDGALDGTNTIERGSYVGITPDGRYLVGYDSADWAVNSTGTHYGLGAGVSWEVDHAGRRIGAPNHFWNLCGDHGTFMSTSDGRDYMIVSACIDSPGLYRVDITWNAEGRDEAEQLDHNQRLIDLGWSLGSHVTAVARGPLRDWMFLSSEDGSDDYDSGADDGSGNITPWREYAQEIIGIDVLTGEIRRLAHHRSRHTGEYVNQPRVSVSWGGEHVGWQSNFDQRDSIDTYAIALNCGG